jgi:hypothetical protein
MKAQIGDHGEASVEQRVRLGQLVKSLLDERRDHTASELVASLRADWPHVIVNPVKDDSTILNAAVLTGRDEQAALERAIHELDRRYADRINFRCVGPLPPYSFATAEVKTIESSRLDAAGRLLELGETASLAEIKGAYRRLLQEVHPDRNAEAGAADRLKEISAAYELLEEYALNFKHRLAGAQDCPVIVRIRSVDDLRAGTSVSAWHAQPRPRECVGVEAT